MPRPKTKPRAAGRTPDAPQGGPRHCPRAAVRARGSRGEEAIGHA